MSAGIALRQAGFSVDLCERDPQWKVHGAGITITGPTLRAMQRLGILDAVREQGYVGDGIDVCDADGAPMFSIDTRDVALGDIPSAGGILRPTLHSILSDRLLALQPGLMLGVTAETTTLTLFTRVSASAMVAASTTIWLLRLTASIPTNVSSCFLMPKRPATPGRCAGV